MARWFAARGSVARWLMARSSWLGARSSGLGDSWLGARGSQLVQFWSLEALGREALQLVQPCSMGPLNMEHEASFPEKAWSSAAQPWQQSHFLQPA